MSNPLTFPGDALQQLSGVVRDLPGEPGALRSVALTSAVQDEGVSSAALALATSLATGQQQRVLLVDANLRRPGLHALCDLPRTPGLSELLHGEGSWQQQGHPMMDKLRVLTAGAAVDNPTRLLQAAALKAGIASVAQDYDWVIFDCPAVNNSAETVALAAACNGCVLVVRSGRTRREIVQDAKRRLEQGGAHLAGAVLNRRRYYIPEALYRWL